MTRLETIGAEDLTPLVFFHQLAATGDRIRRQDEIFQTARRRPFEEKTGGRIAVGLPVAEECLLPGACRTVAEHLFQTLGQDVMLLGPLLGGDRLQGLPEEHLIALGAGTGEL